MNDAIYHRLAGVLDTLPNGFPATEIGVELKLLKKIFTPEQAELFCEMRLTFETSEEISERTGRPLETLKKTLLEMADRGQIFMIKLDGSRYFRMLPWVFGIYEFQLGRIDRELSELYEEYHPVFSRQFFSQKPQLMQTLPIEESIPSIQEALPYERVSAIIENGQSFLANDCICKKQKELIDHPCIKPMQVCLAVAPIPGVFDKSKQGKVLSREEAYELLKKTEEAGLVHLTSNIQVGQIYICNCCSCCCGVLSAINELGIPASSVINSHYYAGIDPDACINCGLCADERCQVKAIKETEETYQILPDHCIGCGLCISTCPVEAIELIRREHPETRTPPFTEDDWFTERGRARDIDFSDFK